MSITRRQVLTQAVPVAAAVGGAASLLPASAAQATAGGAPYGVLATDFMSDDEKDHVLRRTGVDISASLQKALNSGGLVMLPEGTFSISKTLEISAPYSGLVGVNPQTSNSGSQGTIIKWVGPAGGDQSTMVRCGNGIHGPCFIGIGFDANDRADICLHLDVKSGEALQFPYLTRLNFRGYRRRGLVLGMDDTRTLGNGQLQMTTLEHVTWWGGGASAPDKSDVIGLLINAENCEITNCLTLYFDPFTSVGGGPYVNHQNHIKVVSGGLHITGMVTTRASAYAIDVVRECGLVVDHWRSEDLKLVNYPQSAGIPSNPVQLRNIDHRSGFASGTEDVIVMKYSGDTPVAIENCRITGNIALSGSSPHQFRVRNVKFREGKSGTGTIAATSSPGAILDLEAVAGQRRLFNPAAKEEWFDAAGARLYTNDGGSLANLKGLSATAQKSMNFGGAFTITGSANSAAVNFAVPEADAAYRVAVTPLEPNGNPALGSNRVLSVMRTTKGFTVHVETAPGGAASVSFSWLLFRA